MRSGAVPGPTSWQSVAGAAVLGLVLAARSTPRPVAARRSEATSEVSLRSSILACPAACHRPCNAIALRGDHGPRWCPEPVTDGRPTIELTDVVHASGPLDERRTDDRAGGELDRRAAHRLAVIRHAQEVTGNVSKTYRYYGITREAYLHPSRGTASRST
jgi:hypothetical protein